LSLKSLTFSLNNPRSSSPISSAQPLTLYAVEVVQVLLPASAISPAGHDGQGWVLRGLGAIEGTRSSLEVEQDPSTSMVAGVVRHGRRRRGPASLPTAAAHPAGRFCRVAHQADRSGWAHHHEHGK
jgi:hypothetical protein